jgi:menaquinol-cytochrome c reductase iron-sulfur subunit
MNHEDPAPLQDPLDRRNFFKIMFGMLSGLITVMFSWPLLSFLAPASREKEEDFVKVPNFGTVPVGKPTKLTFQYINNEAFLRQNEFHDVWVIKRSTTDVTVFSPLCTHLSCRYGWKESQQQFACPCHGSVFDVQGEVVAGPAPRPLDILPHKITGGELYVQWKAFKPGIPRKIEA